MPLLGFMNPFDNVYDFIPDRDIPNLTHKVIIVTGGNSGCGKETVLRLAKHQPRCIYLATRTQAKYDDAMKDIAGAAPKPEIRYLELDLASLVSVKKAASTVLATHDRLDLLINNAGIMAHPHSVTAEGYEIQFGTNHLGHALLIHLLLPLMQRTALQPNSDVRIITLSSFAHNFAPEVGINFVDLKSDVKTMSTFKLYGQSKLANILYTHELSRRFPEIVSVSLHPGRVQSNLGNVMTQKSALTHAMMHFSDGLSGVLSVEEGAVTQLWAATCKRLQVKSGAYYMSVGKERAASKLASNTDLARKLWEWTEEQFKGLGY